MTSPDFREGWDAHEAAAKQLLESLAQREAEPSEQYRVVSTDEAVKLGIDPDTLWSDYCWVLLDAQNRVVGCDGGEPEDQLLIRDWKWVAPALNEAYARGLAAARATPPDPEMAARERLGTFLVKHPRWMWDPEFEFDDGVAVALWNPDTDETHSGATINAALDAAESAERGKGG